MLAHRDLSTSRDELVRLLRLDPLTLVRCLRIASAPISRPDPFVRAIPELLNRLGRSFVLRAFQTATPNANHDRRLHGLWLHSIATAIAARTLAEVSETLDPEEAYLRGLLYKLPRWLEQLDPEAGPREFDRWNLGATLACDGNRAEVGQLLNAAEVLADLADFPAPGDEDVIDREDVLASISRESLVQARELRRTVHRELDFYGLDSAFPSVPRDLDEDPDASLFRFEPPGSHTEFIAGLLMCRQSSRYRAIVTVATSAALRYLDFDRATFVAWRRASHQCFVKAKADYTIRKLEPMHCSLEPAEEESLREALASERPQRVTCAGGNGLLNMLGAEEALLVMVSREFETPTFLVLDRTLSARSLDLDVDPLNAAALGGTVSILTDNLRLRLERIRAQRFAVIDPLTRLNNRAVGLMALEREMLRAQREQLSLSVLMLDLDEFKDLNDTHGHLVGDQALKLTANVLRRTLRRSDVVCRYGGEEFLVVLPATDPQEASILAARLFVEVEEAGNEYRLPLTVSIGLSSLREGDQTIEDIVGRADRALYASKARGRNRFSVDIF